MQAISSSEFIKEFTVYAEQTYDKDETFIIQRANGKNLVLLSMDKYNEYNKKLFSYKKEIESHRSNAE